MRAAPVVVVLLLAVSGLGVSVATQTFSRTIDPPAPRILSEVNFTDVVRSAVTSPSFESLSGDIILVFFALHGLNTVKSVSDSNKDPFSKLKYVLQTTAKGSHGLAIYAATNVIGGSSVTITFQTTSKSVDDTAALAVDVTGVAGRNAYSLSNVTKATGSRSFQNTPYSVVGDRILGFVVSGGYDNWTASGLDSRVDGLTTPLPGAYLTGALFQYFASSAGKIVMSGQSNQSADWIAESVLLQPFPTEYSVTFAESGLPLGTAWSVTVNGTTRGSTTNTTTFNETNGSYSFFAATPALYGQAGFVQVTGAPVLLNVTFSQARSTSCEPYATGFLAQFCGHIDHIVVIFMENHAYDNYFGTYCLTGDNSTAPYCNGTANGLPIGTCVVQAGYAGAGYPAGACPRGEINTWFFSKKNYTIPDIVHNYPSTAGSIDGGKLDGFWQYGGRTANPFGEYNGSTIPVYWDMAQEYAMGDDAYSSTLSYSLPNHWYLIAGQFPDQANFPNAPMYPSSSRSALHPYLNYANVTETVQDLLNYSPDVSWKYYDWPLSNYTVAISGKPNNNAGVGSAYCFWNPMAARYESYTSWYSDHFVNRTDFFSDVATGQLPNVSWVIPQAGFSDHPPSNLTLGEGFVGSLVDSIENSSYWNSTAVFLTWDDYGGFFDHQPPPPADKWGYSFRVPFIVISPYTPEGAIVHQQVAFESILRLIELRWNLENPINGASCITSRDCDATVPSGFFDFINLTSPRPPCLFAANLSAVEEATYPDTACRLSASAILIDPGLWVGSDLGLSEDEED
jgi:phospholipase C